MKAKLGIIIVLFSCSVAFVGCGPEGGSVAKGTQTKVITHEAESASDLWPMAEGNAWVFEGEVQVRNQQGQGAANRFSSTVKVVKTKNTEKGQEVTLDVSQENAEGNNELNMIVDDKTIAQLGFKSKDGVRTFQPAMPLAFWPAADDQKMQWEGTGTLPGTGGKLGKITAEYVCKGFVEVDTPNGRYRAVRFDVEQRYTYEGKEFRAAQRYWFAPKVGLVKTEEQVASGGNAQMTRLELKSATIK